MKQQRRHLAGWAFTGRPAHHRRAGRGGTCLPGTGRDRGHLRLRRIPVGAGRLAAGLHRGFQRNRRAGQRTQTPAGLPAAAFNGVGGTVTGAATAEPFSRTGTLFADGAGGLFADVPSTEFAPKLGSYLVNDDCSVAVTLNNKFAFAGSDAPAATPTARRPL